MKIFHLSDLHLGKQVNGFSMLEDQFFILAGILEKTDTEKPDAVIIAGDVYDKGVPRTEAVEMFDDFLVKLAKRGIQVFMISGNHDSPERLAFAGRLIETAGIHISPVYSGAVAPVTLHDDYGSIRFYMLPFIRPATVRRFFEEKEISSYTDAVRAAVEQMDIDVSQRNILITHQFVTGAERSESEEISVGGTDNVDASVFEEFDYVALGHIHGPQNIGTEKIRYCGTPLKYSFSEAGHKKSITVLEMKEKGDLTVSLIPLVPKRDMVELKGAYDDLMAKKTYEGTTLQEDYTHITLTDESDIPDAISRLRTVYHNLMKLDYDNTRTRHEASVSGAVSVEEKTPVQLFGELYGQQNGREMTEEQTALVSRLVEEIWEGEK